jgi:hypothetical protein
VVQALGVGYQVDSDEDPASISDAIERELRETENRLSRGKPPLVRSALAIALALAWIGRPEAMTAYATLAAAFAARRLKIGRASVYRVLEL